MFGRRSRAAQDTDVEDVTSAQEHDEAEGKLGDLEPVESIRGPWDAVADDVPDVPRIDLGGIQVPMAEDVELQVSVAEDQIVAASVVTTDSVMQVQAFAAPKSSGLWREVRRDMIAEVDEAGGESEESDGPFGTELRASVPPEGAKGTAPLEPARFLGVDGPRWFLRASIRGTALTDEETAARLEEIFAGIVVVRGDSPMPPRDLLELRLPHDAQEALEEQDGSPDLDPFARGPEITEVR